jgi:hypothetical protein
MSWKRLLLSILLGFLILFADAVLLVVVNRLYLPGHPPHWLTGTIFYFDAWPVLITQHIFPRAAGGTYHGPTFPAIAAGGVINLIVFSAIVYALLSGRARRKARA